MIVLKVAVAVVVIIGLLIVGFWLNAKRYVRMRERQAWAKVERLAGPQERVDWTNARFFPSAFTNDAATGYLLLSKRALWWNPDRGQPASLLWTDIRSLRLNSSGFSVTSSMPPMRWAVDLGEPLKQFFLANVAGLAHAAGVPIEGVTGGQADAADAS